MCILNFRIIYQRLNISKVVNSDVMTLCVMHNQCASSQIAVLGEVNIFSFFFFFLSFQDAGTTDKFTTTGCVKILSSFITYTLCCQASDGVNAV